MTSTVVRDHFLRRTATRFAFLGYNEIHIMAMLRKDGLDYASAKKAIAHLHDRPTVAHFMRGDWAAYSGAEPFACCGAEPIIVDDDTRGYRAVLDADGIHFEYFTADMEPASLNTVSMPMSHEEAWALATDTKRIRHLAAEHRP